MGSLVQAHCAECGLEQAMAVGGGMMDFTTHAAVPAGCVACHRLVSVNAKEAPPYRCPTAGCTGTPRLIGELVGSRAHRGERTVFDWLVDDDAGIRYVLDDGSHRCPACGAQRLTFEMAGFFD
jgi:RNA polymerase subunit RPABC4/transcription elongation factor Spt4